ncbi:hypothetical protein [Kushneria phosphatilytica]|uniref:Nuclear transport factor 2 family protein n=1 Tax=Kushneria phosphatilytica TaxID=657387 RepID=A0A1S1NW16_9GAMM|nr:hypothetical protein [Kushneria phosphatilytica]OHV12151.1 hypothetical protein BH688_05725 [Kushneria phosphatilytica]QEL11344.1 nuclear transport factor 2 family protein [Kushneria phosphatilytica]
MSTVFTMVNLFCAIVIYFQSMAYALDSEWRTRSSMTGRVVPALMAAYITFDILKEINIG